MYSLSALFIFFGCDCRFVTGKGTKPFVPQEAGKSGIRRKTCCRYAEDHFRVSLAMIIFCTSEVPS